MTVLDPAGRRVVVMGLGSFGGGVGAARFLARRGARVLVTDLRPKEELEDSLAPLMELDLETVLGEHRARDFETADWVVANPAVSPDHPLLVQARARGARIVTEVGLALEHVATRFIAITGTQGKSSTCRMTTDLLRAAGFDAVAGGNLGGSLLDQVEHLGPESLCVLELSSYQLEHLAPPPGASAPAIDVEAVALLPVLPDHLDRHGSMSAYAACKLRILTLLAPGGTAFLPAELPLALPKQGPRERRVVHSATPFPGATLRISEGRFLQDDVELGRVDDLILPRFQRSNALVALGLAYACGAHPSRLASAIGDLGAPEHRLQDLGLVGERRVFDNGVSTTPDSTASALHDLPEERCILILGGRDKGLDPTRFVEAASERVELALVFGEASGVLFDLLTDAGVKTRTTGTVEEAVQLAFAEGPARLPILFSPACSSFDAFPNFRARALAFRRALPTSDARALPQ